MRVHYVVVAHNVAVRCAEHFRNESSGTLILRSDLSGDDHCGDLETCEPFQVGWVDGEKDFVHVLDDASLEILLRNRDTITDFIDYLERKEELLVGYRDSGVTLVCPGEEELLANFLVTMKNGRHDFSFPEEYNYIWMAEGDWASFEESPERKAQILADEVSYGWDGLIEKFSQNLLGGTSFYTNQTRVADREKLLRVLAAENRVRRRLLSESFLQVFEMAGVSSRATRVMQPSKQGDPYYCFLLLPHLPSVPDDEYRRVRQDFLYKLCCITKMMFPDAHEIVGIATETEVDRIERSEDAVYMDVRVWTQEQDLEARATQEATGLLTNLTSYWGKTFEYPVAWDGAVEKNPRNKLCPCGSGQKYKRCHGS